MENKKEDLSMKRTLDEIGMYAMAAKPHMQLLGTTKKNQALEAVANALNEKADYLIAENEKDMQHIWFFSSAISIWIYYMYD